MKNFSLLLLVCLLVSACTAHYPLKKRHMRNGMPVEPGKCFAKSLMMDQTEIVYDTIATLGVAEEVPMDLRTYTEETPKSTIWVKKKADKNCMSADPNDCLVWCLQETGGEIIQRESLISIDTAMTQPVKYVVTEKTIINEHGGHTEWVEVLCEHNIYDSLYKDIRLALVARGYDCDLGTKEAIKKPLLQFQKDNELPNGQLDIYTMQALGIR